LHTNSSKSRIIWPQCCIGLCCNVFASLSNHNPVTKQIGFTPTKIPLSSDNPQSNATEMHHDQTAFTQQFKYKVSTTKPITYYMSCYICHALFLGRFIPALCWISSKLPHHCRRLLILLLFFLSQVIHNRIPGLLVFWCLPW